ncbi:MAG: hypothetical protein IKV50_06660 [Clostridia bacterium]|nr:hypothetical protein [Clostridia bacterium]MBR6553669.1 hypothetical protein [Clostridia bacterium]
MPTQSKRKRILPVFLAVLFVIAVTVATVYAYLKTSTPAVENTFSAAQDPEATITESFDPNTEKKNVAVKVGDTGYSVYVRAVIVVTWKNAENGDVLAIKPVAGTDYEISLNDSEWFEKDGFYYHKAAVESGDSTAVLINSCAPIDGKTPAGYGLNVEIVAQTIQAAGKTDAGDIPAVTKAWKVKVDSNGKLTKE